MTDLEGKTLAVLGGTGPQGRGLARRFAAAGVPVVIGSRSAERASATAADLAGATGGRVRGADNAAAARAGDIVVVAVPWDGHSSTVVAAFHHVSAVRLEDPRVTSLDTDVLVLGDDRQATELGRRYAARS